MGENGGCLKWIGLASFVVALLIWMNNVDTIVIKEQIPPPQDSWEVVYPKFRDDVSAQLLNTQEMIGNVIEGASYIKSQNSEIQYSLDILFNELGIIREKSAEESKRQRFEQWVATGLSIVLGWLLAAFIPTGETLARIRKVFSKEPTRDISEHQESNKRSGDTDYTNIFLEVIRTNPIVRLLLVLAFILGIAIIVILAVLEFVL